MHTTKQTAPARSGSFIAFLFFAGLACAGAGCGRPNETQKIPTDQEAAAIVRQSYPYGSDFAFSMQNAGNAYIVSFIREDEEAEPRLLVLKREAEEWREQPLDQGPLVCSTFDCPSEAEKTDLNGKPYVFFTTVSYGTDFGSVAFNLFSPSEKRLYTMSVGGKNGKYNQADPIPEDVQARPDIQAYLAKKISVSPEIDHTGNGVTQADDPAQALDRWREDNSGAWDLTLMEDEKDVPVTFTYYPTDVAKGWENSVGSSTENNWYAFTSYFKGPVVGMDKVKKNYFVVWVPVDDWGWMTELNMEDKNTLTMESNDGSTLRVHLDTGRISKP